MELRQLAGLQSLPVRYVNAGILCLGVLGMAASYFLHRGKDISHTAILKSAFALVDIYIDGVALVNLAYFPEGPTLFKQLATAMLLSLVANLVFLLYTFRVESGHNIPFAQWQTTHFRKFVTVFCLACFDMQLMPSIYSGVFGWAITNAPLSEYACRHLDIQ